MLAAITAAENGAAVTLLEKNEKLGKKIYITGKGRCNVTNACTPEQFRQKVVKNPRFLYSALDAFSPSDMMEKLEKLGCPVKVERGERVFPASEKASDVTRALERELHRLRVEVRLHAEVEKLLTADGAVSGVMLKNGESLPAHRVIVATGGQSYPTTGSTGDGFRWLSALGHTVFPPLPSLIPLTSDAGWIRALQGLSLKNVRLTLKSGKKTLFTDIGEMLFTHFGISGPLVLSASAYVTEMSPEDFSLTLDLKPGLSEDQLNQRILRDLDASGKKQLRTLLGGLFPSRLAEEMPALCGFPPETLACDMTREMRQSLVRLTKELPLPISGTRPLQEAVVTRGGVSVKEMDPRTMESKLIPGLYVTGELLDVDAMTGGFNLQIAFSTGYLAGQNAAFD